MKAAAVWGGGAAQRRAWHDEGGGQQHLQRQRATPTHEAEAAAHGEHDVRVELDAQRAPVHVKAHVGAAVQRVRLRKLSELEGRGRREVDYLHASSSGGVVVGQACAPQPPQPPPPLSPCCLAPFSRTPVSIRTVSSGRTAPAAVSSGTEAFCQNLSTTRTAPSPAAT